MDAVAEAVLPASATELRASWFAPSPPPIASPFPAALETEARQALVSALNREANLTFVGKIMAGVMLNSFAEQNACVSRSATNPPSARVAAAQRADAPLIVLGLPRTGTTFLHTLLSIDTQRFRAPRFHEYMDACPRPAKPDESLLDNTRVMAAHARMAVTRMLVPSMSDLHHVDGETPEEDVVVFAYVFSSVLFPTVFRVPSYAAWLRNASSHREHAVKFLAWALDNHFRDDGDGRAWLLKTPQHVMDLGALADAFPRARFVWTHRDPVAATSSVVSVVARMVGLGTDSLRDGAVVRHLANETTEMWVWASSQAMQQRARVRDSLLDVSFTQLTQSPLDTVKRIYAWAGWSLPARVESDMKRFIQTWHATGKTGRHKHQLARFGLAARDISDAFVSRAGYDPATRGWL